MEYIKVEYRPTDDGWSVSVGHYLASAHRRYPVLLAKPWQHHYTLSAPLSEEQLFKAITSALRDLAAEPE